MRRVLIGTLVCASLLCGVSARAQESGSVQVEGRALAQEDYETYQSTTYVSLRAVSEALDPDAIVSWKNGQAVVESNQKTMMACPGAQYVETRVDPLYVPYGVKVWGGRVFVPVRTLAAALDASVAWEPSTGSVIVSEGADTAQTGKAYSEEDLYWMSRIISAESQGESMSGKIAVGNVILNRVASSEFPNTIKGVIFDSRWGGQFTPVSNGTIYNQPTEQSVIAAKLVLNGANVSGASLYFFAPSLTSDRWISASRSYVMTIGCHWFYK